MTTGLTRRELRELERRGASTPEVIASSEPAVSIETAVENAPMPSTQGLTRREMRERGLLGTSPQEISDIQPPAVQTAVPAEPAAERVAEPVVLQSRRQFREAMIEQASEPAVTSSAVSGELVSLDSPEESGDDLVFTGVNMLAEPTTQSIILDLPSDPISLPVDTGEITITGSISIVSDPTTDSQPAGFDIDSDLTSESEVVGVVSSVNPVSASDLIDLRAPIGVVPQSVLRKGWWKPWAVALGALALAITAILSSITILGALGG